MTLFGAGLLAQSNRTLTAVQSPAGTAATPRPADTRETPQVLADINPGPALSGPLDFAMVGRVAYFAVVLLSEAGDGSVRTELWRTDGTEAGTERVWQAPGRANGYSIRDLTAFGGVLFFPAPRQADANGIATDFEPHIVRARVALEAGSEAVDDESADDQSADDESAADHRSMEHSARETDASIRR